jgi:hypothetical protein
MNAQPLKKAIYNKAKEFGIESITLHFSGGNDEGYLDIEIDPSVDDTSFNKDFHRQIEDWAWQVYDYNGAGEGDSYGDDIVYDLKNGKVSTSVWYMARQDENEGNDELEIANDEE